MDIASISENLIRAIDLTVSLLRERTELAHKFRSVSNAQAVPANNKLLKWMQNGQVGPMPLTQVEFRATIYDQATTASELKAFSHVSSAAIIELGETVALGLRSNRLIVAFTSLRGLVERVAHLVSVSDQISSLKELPENNSLEPVLSLSEVIHKAIFATQHEWAKVIEADFRDTSSKDLKYVQKENIANPKPTNILTAMDRLDSHIPGSRVAYEVLCEFLHPNIGDLWGTTLDADSFLDKHGTRHIFRSIGIGQKTIKNLPDNQKIYRKLFDICRDILLPVPAQLSTIDEIAKSVSVVTKRFAHSMVRQNRVLFSGSDFCPCLSGLTVAACTGLKSK